MDTQKPSFNTTITRRTALASMGLVGSLGLTGCINAESIFESSSITIINNNTQNKVSVKILSENRTVLHQKKYNLKPNASPSSEYSGHAASIDVAVNGKKINITSFTPPSSSCDAEQILVNIRKNETVSVDISCIAD